MLSRVAESLYWMSRYMERAENIASFLDVNFHLMLDLNKITDEDEVNYWEPLIQVTYDAERFTESYDAYNAETVTDFLVFSKDNPNSIRSCIAFARENARGMIESISSEMWEALNSLYHKLENTKHPQVEMDPYSFYRDVKMGSQLFQGITDATMLRSEACDFVQVGKYMERADSVARLVDVKYHMLLQGVDDRFESVDVLQWMAVLKSCSALEAYRKVHQARVTPDHILNFLILDRSFPRSVLFCVAAAQDALWRISGSSRGNTVVTCDRMIGKLDAELSYTTIDDMYSPGLHNYLVALETRLASIGAQIHETYFAYRLADPETAEKQARASLIRKNGAARAMWRDAEPQQQQQQ